ncbi:hypothetical protein AVEN_182056-1 [Araneus ventricosus]|uniref:Uncharacterized protein n=1 Tax=Araneus ventricosus TaxID=182803 RepID=A0A4Y2PXE6_ARAVE|nr:hypothetical protein AVEN_182056-1 [Araneus ventricosus]
MQLISSVHDMRRRPHWYKKAEHMTCDADRTGTKKPNIWLPTPTVLVQKAKHMACDADRTGTKKPNIWIAKPNKKGLIENVYKIMWNLDYPTSLERSHLYNRKIV